MKKVVIFSVLGILSLVGGALVRLSVEKNKIVSTIDRVADVIEHQDEILKMSEMPLSPPGLVLPEAVGQFEREDFTDFFREQNPGKSVAYSGNWQLNFVGLKVWATMTPQEQSTHMALRGQVESALVSWVKGQSGILEIKTSSLSETMHFAEWKVSEGAYKKWQLTYSAPVETPDGKPKIVIFISHVE